MNELLTCTEPLTVSAKTMFFQALNSYTCYIFVILLDHPPHTHTKARSPASPANPFLCSEGKAGQRCKGMQHPASAQTMGSMWDVRAGLYVHPTAIRAACCLGKSSSSGVCSWLAEMLMFALFTGGPGHRFQFPQI